MTNAAKPLTQTPEDEVDYFYITEPNGDKYLVLPDLTRRLVKKGKRQRKADVDPISFKL